MPVVPTAEDSLSSRPNAIIRKALIVGLITLIVSCILCVIALRSADYDPLSFARIGTYFSEHLETGTIGYDGQFVYFIARYGADATPYIDGPTLRYQRILYPILARLLSLGSPVLVPWVLILINVLAHSIGASLLAYLLGRYKASVWGGLIYGLWIGEIFAFRLDLNEPLCMTLAIAAVIAYHHRHYRWTIFLLVLSTMAKELGLVIAAGLALHAWFSHERRWAVLFVISPLITFLTWWGIMRLWLGTFPTIYPAAKVHLIPFQGMFTEDNPLELIFLILWLGLPALVLFISAVRTAIKRRTLRLGTALILLSAGWVMVMPDVSWQDPVAAYRVAIPLIVSTLVYIGESYPRRLKWLAALWLPTLLLAVMTPTLWIYSR